MFQSKKATLLPSPPGFFLSTGETLRLLCLLLFLLLLVVTANFGKGVRQLSLTVRTETMDESPAGYQVVSCNSQGMQFLFPVK